MTDKQKAKLAEIKASEDLTITPEDAAMVLGVAPQSIRIQAQEDPKKLGFPVVQMGKRTMIVRGPFLAYMGVAG